jgi:hypothetical protein
MNSGIRELEILGYQDISESGCRIPGDQEKPDTLFSDIHFLMA